MLFFIETTQDAFNSTSAIPQALLEEYLDCPQVCIARFNPNGTILATGSQLGYVSLWDTSTWDLVHTLYVHVAQITNLCWSQDGRILVAASKDWSVSRWLLTDIDNPVIIRTNMPVVHCMILYDSMDSPRCDAAQQEHVDILSIPLYGQPVIYRIMESDQGAKQYTPIHVLKFEDADFDNPLERQYTCAALTHQQDRLFLGTARGMVFVMDPHKAFRILHTCRVSQFKAPIKEVLVDQRDLFLVINCADRIVRTYLLSTDENENPLLQIENKFQDLVSRTLWSRAMFTPDGEFIVTGSGGKPSHDLFIWDRHNGNLLHILQGSKETMDDFDWHPRKPLIASVTCQGFVYIWTTVKKENWSAFAPGFEELEENIEYEEREDEYDIYPEKEDDFKIENIDEQVNIVTLSESEQKNQDQKCVQFPCLPKPFYATHDNA